MQHIAITREQFSALPREKQEALVMDVRRKKFMALPRAEQERMVMEKRQAEIPKQPEMSSGKAFRTSAESAATLGFTPVVAGAGAALGAGVGALQQGRGFGQALTEGKEAFFEGRQERKALEAEAGQQAAGTFGTVLGTAATLPLTAVKGLAGAAKLGGVLGVGQAGAQAEEVADIPAEIAKGVGIGVATEGALGVGGKVVKRIAKSAVGQATKEGLKRAVTKSGGTLSGMNESSIRTFIDKGDEVTEIIKKTGGEVEDAAEGFREGVNKALQTTRETASTKITKAIDSAPKTSLISPKGTRNAIANVVKTLDPKANKADIGEIKRVLSNVLDEVATKTEKKLIQPPAKLINILNAQGKPTKVFPKKIEKDVLVPGELSLKQAQVLKQKFDDIASKGYFDSRTKVFVKSSAGVVRAAKAAANSLRAQLGQKLPAVKEANKVLSNLRKLEPNIPKGFIKDDTRTTAIFTGGSGANRQNRSILRKIGKITGVDHLEEAKVLAAAKDFAKPPILPVDTTGKSVARLGLTAGIATIAGPTVAALAAMATSPVALKTAIRAGQITDKLAKKIFEKATPSVKSILIQKFNKIDFDQNNKKAIDRRSKGQ